jgi:hypothetical protein
MSQGSIPGSVGIGTATVQPAEMAPGAGEFDLGCYGWRVVLSACLGVIAGFGSLFVYTFSVFVKPLTAEFGWSREAISSGFAIAAVTLGLCPPSLDRWIDRFWASPHHSYLHDGVRLRHCILVPVCALDCGSFT